MTASDLRDRHMREGYLYPTYGDYSIANLPDTVATVFGIDAPRPLPMEVLPTKVTDDPSTIEHVVVVVIDGFGWNRFETIMHEFSPLRRLTDAGTVSTLTSTYPSETAAAMITMYTGLQPIEHGQLGWFTWFEPDDFIGLSLPFSTLDGRSLADAYGYDPTVLFDIDTRETITERLIDEEISVSFVQPEGIADSPTSRYVSGRANRRGFATVDAGIDSLSTTIERASGPTYQQFYYPDVDTAAHRQGTHSIMYRDVLNKVVTQLNRRFIDRLDPGDKAATLLMIVADHGHIDTTPETNIDIGQLEASGAVDLDAHLRRTVDGHRTYLAGSPRNVQFYTRDGHTEVLRDELEAELDVRTFSRAEYLEANLFGDRTPGRHFRRRAPDLLMVPSDHGVWYDDGELALIGMHGGMHPHEMLVPLVTLRLDEIE